MSRPDNEDISEDAVDARELSPEEMQELMPEQKPNLLIRILMHAAGVLTFLMVFSPAIAWFVWGIEASAAFFMAGFLVVLIQR